MGLEFGDASPGLLPEGDDVRGGPVLAAQFTEQLASRSDLGQALGVVLEVLRQGARLGAGVSQLGLESSKALVQRGERSFPS